MTEDWKRDYRRLSLHEVPAWQRELAEREAAKAAWKCWIAPPAIRWWKNISGDGVWTAWVDDDRPWNVINLCTNILDDSESLIATVWEEVKHCQQFRWKSSFRFEPQRREKDADDFVLNHTGIINKKKLKPWEYKE